MARIIYDATDLGTFIVLLLSAAYFACVFRLPAATAFNTGMGDWVDPYFINYLLEHWYHSIGHLTSPASPPMYFPEHGTLGYSHGLVLFAPFYIAVRPFLHPFQAYNAAIFLVLNTGTICLYLIVRKFLRLGFVESLLVTAFFATSANLINEAAGVWTQRVSVFLIPHVLLTALVATRMPRRDLRIALAWASGLGFALLFTQDFYTAAFAVLVAGLFLAGTLRLSDLKDRTIGWWQADRPYLLAISLGALMGGVVFARIYIRAYLDHPAFPENQLNNALTVLDLSPFEFGRALRTYESLRSFELAFLAAALAWLPWFRVDRNTRLCALWFALVSVIVLAIPLRIHDFSIWKMVFARVPGFSAIRDPKRVIECYELAAAFLAAVFLARLPRRSPLRLSVALIMFLLIVTGWNGNVFNFSRPIGIYVQWVEAPIQIDSSCRAFFIKGATDGYMSRSSNRWGLYAMDSMFISLRTGLPTLNGYSAWWPDGWRLSNPQERGYAENVEQWIARNGLRDVCELNIEARTMKRHVAVQTSP